MIYTDDSGRPFEAPEPPGPGATLEERLAYIRARNAYRDTVVDRANRAFADSLKKALRGA